MSKIYGKIVNFIFNFKRMSIIMLYLRYKEKNNQLGKKIFHLQNTEYKLQNTETE